jgi:WD40 repeat protein
MEGHEDSITALVFSPDGTLLASASDDGSIRLWDVISATLASVLSSDDDSPVSAITFDSDGTHLVSGSENGGLQIWEIASSEPTGLEGDDSAVLALTFNSDGDLLVSAGSSDRLHFWNVTAEEEVAQLEGYGADAAAQVTDLTFSPDGTTLVFVTIENGQSTIRLWGVVL